MSSLPELSTLIDAVMPPVGFPLATQAPMPQDPIPQPPMPQASMPQPPIPRPLVSSSPSKSLPPTPTPNKRKLSNSHATELENDEPVAASSPPPHKRARGHPKGVAKSNANNKDGVKKRGRGRPKKVVADMNGSSAGLAT